MLEGLEIKEVNFKKLFLNNLKFRLDDEFFLKKYLSAEKKIRKVAHDKLENIISLLTDYHANGSYASLNNNVTLLDKPGYAYMVRSTDLENLDFDSSVKYVDKHAYNFLKKTKLYGNEILINKIGNPGNVYLMPKLDKLATVGMNLFMFRLKNETCYTPEFLYVFFNSKIGQNIIFRHVNGTVPLSIDKDAVRSLLIPQKSHVFQSNISKLVKAAFSRLLKSKNYYRDSEKRFSDLFQINKIKNSSSTINIKSLKDSFLNTGRMDAEYYQPKYEKIVNIIKSNNYAQLQDLVNIKKSIEPGSEAYNNKGIPFLRVADYNKFGINKIEKRLSKEFIEENELDIDALKPSKGTILFSKDGSVGTAYNLKENADFITSSAILHLTIKDKSNIKPEYLSLVLNSDLVQLQAERDAGGSIILHWRIDQIKEILVPILNYNIQEEISDKIEQSFELKKQSEQLLELAKTAVEKAIEEDEEKAIDYINKKLDELKIQL